MIRVDADEVTYSLHIILRFELEQELVAGSLRLEDLPEAWNARMKAFLGIDVPDDLRGVLQDVHWTRASYGYFPTYALGNALSVQIWRWSRGSCRTSSRLEAGEFGAALRVTAHALYRTVASQPMETLSTQSAGPDRPAAYLGT